MWNTLLLDLDGTILDSQPRHHAVYGDILREHGLPILGTDEYWRRKRAGASPLELLTVTGAEGIAETFRREWLARVENDHYLTFDPVLPGAKEKLAEWRNSGLRLIVLTLRQNHSGLLAQLARCGLSKSFDTVLPCTHAGGGEGKASRLREFAPDLVPSSCLWIGDTEMDVAGARAFGCPIACVASGVRDASFLRNLAPDYVFPALAQINLETIVWR